MNRLQAELHRLYLPRSPAPAETDAPPASFSDASGNVRVLVMALARPASWALLSRVWQGVQAELELPAPAIAVSGVDALQLWFSLAEPIAASQAHAFLEGLRMRFLPDVDAGRVRLMLAPDASALHPDRHARQVPAEQETGNWSAFVAPDLAPVFDDTPWLDIPPGEEGQATLLRTLATITPAEFEAASQRLAPDAAAAIPPTPPTPPTGATVAEAAAAAQDDDPRRFLTRVMNDDSVALALRIEAARALLQHAGGQPPR